MVSAPEPLQRTYPASPEEVWRLWTTADGISAWWAPDGFVTEVSALELRPGGELVYAMTATAPEQVAFLESMGMPLTTESRKTFTEVAAPSRLGYLSLIDFVPGHEPYQHQTLVEFEPVDGGTRVTMTMDALHDDEWTGRLVAGRTNEMANLAALLAGRGNG